MFRIVAVFYTLFYVLLYKGLCMYKSFKRKIVSDQSRRAF